MKTYEEMARDVLKRRDEELQKLEALQQTDMNNAPPEVVYPAKSKKSILLPLVAVPCAAALAIGAVTVGTRYNGLRENGENVMSGAAESSGNSVSQLANVAEIDDRSETPLKPAVVYDVEDRINILDDVPDYIYNDHAIFNNPKATYPWIDIPLTEEEWISWFGVELDRLGRLHNDWIKLNENGDHGSVNVYGGNAADSENSGGLKIGGRKAVWEAYNAYGYDFKDGGDEDYDLLVSAMHIGVFSNAFDPFASCPDSSMISYINGRQAFIYNYTEARTGCHNLRAIIDYGQTLVTMWGYDLSDEEFVSIIDEFTAPEYDIEITPWSAVPKDKFVKMIGEQTMPVHDDLINILDSVPDSLKGHELVYPHNVMGPMISVELTMDEFNSFFGMEADRLTRLHPDWGVIAGGNTPNYVCAYVGDDNLYCCDKIGGKPINDERYYLGYNIYDGRGYLGEGDDLWIRAIHTRIRQEVFSPFDFDGDDPNVSYINGRKAVIFRDPDRSEETECDCIDAIIEFGDTLVSIIGLDLTEEEFLNILDEYTSREYDIAITPWSEVPQNKFTEIINNSDT